MTIRQRYSNYHKKFITELRSMLETFISSVEIATESVPEKEVMSIFREHPEIDKLLCYFKPDFSTVRFSLGPDDYVVGDSYEFDKEVIQKLLRLIKTHYNLEINLDSSVLVFNLSKSTVEITFTSYAIFDPNNFKCEFSEMEEAYDNFRDEVSDIKEVYSNFIRDIKEAFPKAIIEDASDDEISDENPTYCHYDLISNITIPLE